MRQSGGKDVEVVTGGDGMQCGGGHVHVYVRLWYAQLHLRYGTGSGGTELLYAQ